MTERRHFLGLTAAGLAALGLPAAHPLEARQGDDEPWLAAIRPKRHRIFLDVHQFTGDFAAFTQADSILAALATDYKVPAADIGMAFGAHGTGLAFLLKESVWADFDLGALISAKLLPADQELVRGAVGSMAAAAADRTRTLKGKGVRVLACRNTIGRWSRRISALGKGTPDAIAKRIVEGLHDGVEPVPAMLVAAMLASERGVPVINAG